MRARMGRKRSFVLGGLGIAVIAGVAFAVVSAKQTARREAEAAAAALRGCLLGGPLELGETAWQRVRRRQLSALAVSEVERGTQGAKLWPLSCRDAAGKVLDVLKRDASEAHVDRLSKLIKFLNETSAASKDATAVLEPVLALLDERLPGAGARQQRSATAPGAGPRFVGEAEAAVVQGHGARSFVHRGQPGLVAAGVGRRRIDAGAALVHIPQHRPRYAMPLPDRALLDSRPRPAPTGHLRRSLANADFRGETRLRRRVRGRLSDSSREAVQLRRLRVGRWPRLGAGLGRSGQRAWSWSTRPAATRPSARR